VIDVEDHDGIAVVRFEKGKVNALDLEVLEEITGTLVGLHEADGVVLTGAGRSFSAGVDLKRLVDGGPEHVGAFLPALVRAIEEIFDFPRPVVAAINGHAIAGGCILAVAADHRVMSGGTIGLTEILVGVPFPAAALEVMRFAAGPRLTPLVLTGRTIGPDAALAAGLIHEICEPDALVTTAVERAATLARIPRTTFAMVKAQLHRPARRAIAEGASDDADVLAVWQSAETLGGMARFLEGLAGR